MGDGGRRVVLSDDRRQMTIVAPARAGVGRITLGRGPDQEPFTDDDVQHALATVLPSLSKPGQRNLTRRWVTPFGTVYAHLMLGPPTWWWPKVRLRGGPMVGWLRAAVALGFRGEASRG